MYRALNSPGALCVKVQQQVPIHDADYSSDRAIRFRIGINIGDAIADGTDLHGDAVNVAARLQAECPPGGICVTRPIRDHVQDRLNLAFEELGALSLKNIARPVEAFVLQISGDRTKDTSVGVAGHGMPNVLPISNRPSIAVLPFANLGGDTEHEYFADGVADDIITELSRNRALLVIARSSSFTYRGSSNDAKRVGRDLGVRYVVEGSVRRHAGRVRVNVQLIEAETGNHIWAERYDRALEDIFAVQDEIVEALIIAISPALASAEMRRALRKAPESLGAWEAYQRGMWHMSKGTANEHEQARLLFKRAAELYPGFAAPFVGLALSYHFDVLTYGARGSIDAAHLQHEAARTAVAIDPQDAEAHAALGMAFLAIGNLGASLKSAVQGLALNRNSALSHAVRCGALIWSGHYEEGRGECYMVLRLDPRSPMAAAALGTVAASFYLERRYDETVEAACRCLTAYPFHAAVRRWLIAALGQLGKREDAAVALHEFLAIAPGVLTFHISNRPAYISSDLHQNMMDGLRKAGWQG